MDEINDKSKSDAFVRVLAIIQIGWVTVQVTVRAARGIATSQLELAVVGFVVCAIGIYGLNWQKPKDVQTPLTVLEFPDDIPPAVLDLMKRFNFGWLSIPTGIKPRDRNHSFPGGPIRKDDAKDNVDGSELWWILGLVIACGIFGALHVAAWNFAFPTTIEQVLWRTSSVWCTSFMVVVMLFGGIDTWLFENLFGWEDAVDWYFPVLTASYVLARLFLLVEIFRTLCFLPPDAFLATPWPMSLPHIG